MARETKVQKYEVVDKKFAILSFENGDTFKLYPKTNQNTLQFP